MAKQKEREKEKPRGPIVKFSKSHADRITEEQFISEFKDVYPDLDLKQEYFNLTGKGSLAKTTPAKPEKDKDEK